MSFLMLEDKLLFERVRCKLSVIARPVRTLVVAIPRLEGKCIDNCPTERENLAILAEIVTCSFQLGDCHTSLRTGSQ